nr:hypothetical protein [uncultured Allomuricauda sp.]
MISPRILGEHYFVEYYDPVLVILCMTLLLVSVLTFAKLFFSLFPDTKLSNVKDGIKESICETPDILMQKKGDNIYLDYSIKTTNPYPKYRWVKTIAIILAVILAFTFFGNILNPF